ncbi:hypothetical protein Astex_1442 [Asticcacaulis excentricus CB 48]|uniref:Uncharacterized protein n=1 Tax=Asticcacaulis excentricus (strain ATCC 15261 / DSM 4724 / KCTC 12464 / NCIMB 9791 / VKM B-1370 / CB 48) TaxID=573065 RepID=E8RPL1_ASTEC|nr:hypothetical protein Astex_1442 [Asticcacaulis excentricus CB 48]
MKEDSVFAALPLPFRFGPFFLSEKADAAEDKS